MRRPFENVRPFGPFMNTDDKSEDTVKWMEMQEENRKKLDEITSDAIQYR